MNSLAMLLETGELHPRSQTMQQLHPSTMCVQASLTRRTEKWITASNTHLVCSLKAVIGKDIGQRKKITVANDPITFGLAGCAKRLQYHS